MLTSLSTRPVIVAGLALACSLVAAPTAEAGWEKAQAMLVRPAAGVDADAKGTLEIRIKDNDGRERFRVKAKRVDAMLVHDLYLETAPGSGLFDFVASLDPKDDDELKLDLDTHDGDALPGGVASTADLEGRLVEIRLGADVVLHALVPAYDDHEKLKGKDDLELPLAPADEDVDGRIKVEDKQKKDDQKLEVKVKHLPLGPAAFHLFMDDGLGTLTDLGAFELDDDLEDGKFRLRNKDGDALPFGVWALTELEGRALEVRDDLGTVYLEGSVPVMD